MKDLTLNEIHAVSGAGILFDDVSGDLTPPAAILAGGTGMLLGIAGMIGGVYLMKLGFNLIG